MRKATKLVYPASTARKTTTNIRRVMARDSWDPAQYERFKQERSAPFFDLMALLTRSPHQRVLDLGCGTGELTCELHRALLARETLGVDNSDSMLAQSTRFEGEGLSFEKADLATFSAREPFDIVFSNAAVQWVENHAALFVRLLGLVAPGGQLAVQMPANHDHVSHLLVHEIAAREPYRTALGGYVRTSPVLPVEDYALLLHQLGAEQQQVMLRVYSHTLGSTADIVEWVKGTLLTDYQKRLSAALYEAYLADYRRELIQRMGHLRPCFYPFKRILLWAKK